ncbi:glycoside hydrolase family 76 protein [Patellaria atrata CBS 101060]|uniref:Glycoside hydrolase family 76 protein n=1 Tax=Patellaria atrata CBS 101060 TaxID=1346257 RepID=A0A9P4SE63_9PEZI|nr:glycoside hydrolase family 76 protein [Patellaria atrata CBS 101060]
MAWTYTWNPRCLLAATVFISLFLRTQASSAATPESGEPIQEISFDQALLQPPVSAYETSVFPSNENDFFFSPLEELHNALETMQTHYFELWIGTWPGAIDWTAAVMGTYVSASLFSLTRTMDYILPGTTSIDGQRIENEVNKYFSQAVAYYFGENAFSIRTQAYDDMLWVVLGWLENIKFIKLHTTLHYSRGLSDSDFGWYGKQFRNAFAHRARIFYDITTKGWSTELCGGGMTWNPHLEPYKNAITNELFISAAIGMYLYFPGDDITSPFEASADDDMDLPPAKPHDVKYLRTAIDAYAWLKNSNMTNEKGLYVDGFHIRNYGKNGTIGTGKCDVRNEMVYTYNQGVILSGLRSLWEGTGQIFYLEDGHTLVRNVIAATGWHHRSSAEKESQWAGLGRNGIMEEICDPWGSCSQNGQTFKGIFFHHLTLFCEPLPLVAMIPGRTYRASKAEARLHAESCKEYAPWVSYNAQAALKTKDEKGEFGMWWGHRGTRERDVEESLIPDGAIDYRNNASFLLDPLWSGSQPFSSQNGGTTENAKLGARRNPSQASSTSKLKGNWDRNDRGRGRTVETQGGGVSVLRATWELINLYKNVD